MDDRWMTLQDVAEYLQLSKDLIYRLAQKGKIPASKVGGRWRFKKEKIDQWVEAQSRAAPGTMKEAK
ncbi:MAG: helix-turn-helix domain-containing protein [Chloroflexi bacterium]|nr:helix-turn-helix domain-containing protein [Chloroflexota bacterium]